MSDSEDDFRGHLLSGSDASHSDSDSDAETVEQKPATFADLGLNDILLQACAQVGWTKPTPIQVESIPSALKGRDIIGLAKTGSGKTGAFALPILSALLKKPVPLFALILAPTRELAFQIHENVEALGAPIGVRSVAIVGGVDMMSQSVSLAKKPHVVVATPGRLVDHLENTKGFSLRTTGFLVLDEADRLLNSEFEEEVNKIIKVISKERQTLLFSATMTDKVNKLQRAALRDPVKVEVATKFSTADKLLQSYLFIPAKYKEVYLTYLINEFAGHASIIFVNRQHSAQTLALMLRALGFPAIPLHGGLSQPKRLGALNRFKSGTRNILIATDVAARGLDIPSVDLVINYDLPQNSKDYVHRVGRTARAGRSGKSITFVTQYDVEAFQRIEQLLGKQMDLYSGCEEAQVLLLLERVMEAQRVAALVRSPVSPCLPRWGTLPDAR
ncbi:hypothetical protein, variant [Fonticula alba]|uniref:RNA helicase n=1 Tax=Fonticula alba TaxID=691883 RepID=A0A058Z6L8_FONAL|nr:hypothetical protein, variant [Fonticula alba]KCV69177.1 hypothetical protein, variant [Fonticula alba]|eukprot:XP_009496748.1 hypothetical protein, variant [Fonticula alba]